MECDQRCVKRQNTIDDIYKICSVRSTQHKMKRNIYVFLIAMSYHGRRGAALKNLVSFVAD
jgi:hypothetical protein